MIEKRRVEMMNLDASREGVATYKAVDYVPLDVLEAYVSDARTRWQIVDVGDNHDAGPGGDDGPTTYPAHLEHPLAGQTIGGSA